MDLEYRQEFKDPRTVAQEFEGAAVLQQLIAQRRGFLQIIAFELELSMLGSLPRKHAEAAPLFVWPQAGPTG